MHLKEEPIRKRLLNLVRVISQRGPMLPGDRVSMIGEHPAVYLGVIEAGDLHLEYLQLHIFRLHGGLIVVIEAPYLNRWLCRLLY
jgi:hypothetical protein